MKRIVAINAVNYGSTGNIMLHIADKARSEGNEYYCYCAFSRSSIKNKNTNCYYIGDIVSRNIHLKFCELSGISGVGSILATKKLICQLNDIKPDYLHLHNLHNCYINLPMLFGYIKKKNISVVWTLHDCWSFTGKCPHFTIAKCDKWKKGCFDCPKLGDYPSSHIDNSKLMYKLKKKWFTGIQNLIIVTPSKWLANLVKQSFLKEYQVKVINNGIDLNVFKPIESDFREKYSLQNKRIVLGVAFSWSEKKGLDVFQKLADMLDENYCIVLVGTNDTIDHNLPNNIISIHRTQNQKELAEIYTAADVFVNPTREEVLGLVNIESLACGTPVISYTTGGCPECIDESCGFLVESNDISGLYEKIVTICENQIFDAYSCRRKAELFNEDEKYMEYITLYR